MATIEQRFEVNVFLDKEDILALEDKAKLNGSSLRVLAEIGLRAGTELCGQKAYEAIATGRRRDAAGCAMMEVIGDAALQFSCDQNTCHSPEAVLRAAQATVRGLATLVAVPTNPQGGLPSSAEVAMDMC